MRCEAAIEGQGYLVFRNLLELDQSWSLFTLLNGDLQIDRALERHSYINFVRCEYEFLSALCGTLE